MPTIRTYGDAFEAYLESRVVPVEGDTGRPLCGLDEALVRVRGSSPARAHAFCDEHAAKFRAKAGAQAFTTEELQKFLKDKLGKHEMVQVLEIVPDLPRTAVGKISKKDLYDAEARKTAKHA